MAHARWHLFCAIDAPLKKINGAEVKGAVVMTASGPDLP
jgi:hypothetical protein